MTKPPRLPRKSIGIHPSLTKEGNDDFLGGDQARPLLDRRGMSDAAWQPGLTGVVEKAAAT
jgi:hypothetical protein